MPTEFRLHIWDCQLPTLGEICGGKLKVRAWAREQLALRSRFDTRKSVTENLYHPAIGGARCGPEIGFERFPCDEARHGLAPAQEDEAYASAVCADLWVGIKYFTNAKLRFWAAPWRRGLLVNGTTLQSLCRSGHQSIRCLSSVSR